MRLHRHLRWAQRHVFAALRSTGSMSLTFGVVYAAMVGVSLLAVGSSLRIGRVRNEFAR